MLTDEGHREDEWSVNIPGRYCFGREGAWSSKRDRLEQIAAKINIKTKPSAML